MATTATQPAQGADLLRFRPVRSLIEWKGFPYVFQAPLLIALTALAVYGWGYFTPEGVAAKLYAKSNLVTLIVWGLWWPAMIWVAVLFGRVWCMVCPLELTSNLGERFGRALGVEQRAIRPWVASGAIVVALYALLLLLVAGAQIHRVPAYTSIYVLSLLALSIAVSFRYKDRAFCRGVCPVNELLAVYGRGGVLAFRAGTAGDCACCPEKGCASSRNRYLSDGRSCPSLLNPAKLNDSRDCLLCGQCVKSCGQGNMRFLARKLFAIEDDRPRLAGWPTTLFVMVVSGFVLWEVSTEWKAAEEFFLRAPAAVNKQLGIKAAAGYVNGLWGLVVLPLAVWTALGFILRLLGAASSLGEAWRRMALPVAVVVAAGQMSKALAKFSSWEGFLAYVVRDPAGLATAAGVTQKTLAQPAGMLPVSVVSGIGMFLVLGALGFAYREGKLADRATSRALLVPQLAFACAFLLIIYGWGFRY